MDNNVRTVDLPPMRVAVFHAYGDQPEYLALKRLLAWAEQHNLPAGQPPYRVFGFDNPTPSPGSPNYGYEFWLVVPPGTPNAGDDTTVWREMLGGRYAVLRCEAAPDGSNIPAAWAELARWQEESAYHYPPQRQCLEEHLGPFTPEPAPFVLDLYLPVEA